MRLKAVIEYDGTDYSGFQRQQGQRTVQETLEEAIKIRLGEETRIAGAGRTDSGVHAFGQVVSFDTETKIPVEKITLALNSALPRDMNLKSAEVVKEDFHARFSASSRVYLYAILNQDAPSALLRRYTAHCRKPLDTGAMREAAGHLYGEQDFAGFANELETGHSTFREVMECRLITRGPLVLMRIEANAFLRGMVRTIMGTLIEVGMGKRSAASLPELIGARDRRLSGPSAPAQGLCLWRVRFGARKNYTGDRLRSEAPSQE